ncbi:hypothetical protein [Clostridium lundense]|uniref:hypothetical protein n=1 Tax=Clostridium lundense TaxID=319475 RepID=UPI0004816C8E|nr:hypothetical protein [Clostridium lundense]
MKKILSTIFIVIFMITMSGCGTGNSTQTTSKNNAEEKAQASKNEAKKEEPKFQSIKKDTINKIENYCEFKITNTKFGKRINPPNPRDMYTYYEAKEPGTIYLDTTIDIKSLLTEGRRSSEFLSVKVIYDNKYEYKTFSTIEEKGGTDFTYTNITSIEPLKKGIIHFIAEVPEEVQKDNKPLMVVINLNNKEFSYTIR